MGKIVKYCSSCEEGFAEKFSFCPNCASELSAFEMKPIEDTTPVVEEETVVEEFEAVEPTIETSTENLEAENEVEEISAVSEVEETEVADETIIEETFNEVEETAAVFEPVSFADAPKPDFLDSSDSSSEDILELDVDTSSDEEKVVFETDESPVEEETVFVAEETVEADLTEEISDESIDDEYIEEETVTKQDVFVADVTQEENFEPVYNNVDDGKDDAFHVTVVNERGGKTRNSLLLAATILALTISGGAWGYSLFSNLDDVASLNEDERLLALLNNDPMQTEDEKKPEKKKDDDDGGGGGGGRENPKPTSKGELPNQQETLPPPPQVVPRLTNPELAVINRTQGTNKNRERTGPIGLPDAISADASSGPGSGGGVGRGRGTGVGTGFGTGEGSGTGSGSGSGNGNGNGSGSGGGGGRTPPPPPPKPKPKGPTVGIKILSKPKPGYTDAARQNNVRGVVRVRVAFLASGRIGGVSVVKGLPHGLTEKAIAAARRIRFKPPMRNGVPYSVNKVVQFNFNIY